MQKVVDDSSVCESMTCFISTIVIYRSRSGSARVARSLRVPYKMHAYYLELCVTMKGMGGAEVYRDVTDFWKRNVWMNQNNACLLMLTLVFILRLYLDDLLLVERRQHLTTS